MTKKRVRSRIALGAFAMAIALAGCAKQTPLEAKYPASDCRRVDIVDQATGQAIRGAEDMALDPASGRLFISAYDRRAVEKAIGRRAFSIPEGGVYAIPFSRLLDDGASTVNAASIVRPDDVAGGLRPHGLAFDPDTNEIAFINRGYQRINGKWRLTTRIERVGSNGEVFVGADKPAPCASNNLIVNGAETLISFDHAACNWRAGIEDMFDMKRSGVSDEAGRRLFDHVSFANGIVKLKTREIALAATREDALIVLDETASGLHSEERIELPGGPDNLTLAADGGVVAAVHPSMLRIALSRRLGIGKAPSRIVKVDPGARAVSILFDDPTGKVFSAATVGVERDGALVAGSVTDEGLLVCKAPA